MGKLCMGIWVNEYGKLSFFFNFVIVIKWVYGAIEARIFIRYPV